MSLKSISEIIESLSEEPHLRKALDYWHIVDAFQEAIGGDFARHTRVISFRDGTLRVRVPSAVWGMELSFFEKEIIYRINKRLGRDVVKRIEFKGV